MKKFLVISMGILLCTLVTLTAKSDELKVNVSVENGSAVTKVLGGTIYADIDGKATQILIRPDDQAFFLTGKFGALRLSSFWQTNAKTEKVAK